MLREQAYSELGRQKSERDGEPIQDHHSIASGMLTRHLAVGAISP